MSNYLPFTPFYGSGVTVSAGATSASANLPVECEQVVMTNLGANVAYVDFSTNGQAATTAGYVVPAGAQVTISISRGVTSFRHISASGTTLHVICGEGM
jgi:hypothetical protein